MTDGSTQTEELIDRLRTLLGSADDEALRAFFAELHVADIADCLEQIEAEERSRIIFLLPPRTTAEAIVLLEEAVRSDVLDDFNEEQVSEVLKELPADDAVDVLDELDDEVADKVIERLPPEQKAVVEPLRQYDEDTAGGLMNPDYISVPAEGSVIDAVQEIQRLTDEETEEVYYIYCVDADGRLKGVVPPMRLIIAGPDVSVKDLLLPDLFTVRAEDDQEAVKNMFEKYDLASLPVVDEDDRMLGVITHDDVLEVAEEEADEDMYHMAGTDAEEFATASIFHAAGIRARWLLPCLAGTFAAVVAILFFKPQFHKDIFNIVVVFLTPIAAMGAMPASRSRPSSFAPKQQTTPWHTALAPPLPANFVSSFSLQSAPGCSPASARLRYSTPASSRVNMAWLLSAPTSNSVVSPRPSARPCRSPSCSPACSR